MACSHEMEKLCAECAKCPICNEFYTARACTHDEYDVLAYLRQLKVETKLLCEYVYAQPIEPPDYLNEQVDRVEELLKGK